MIFSNFMSILYVVIIFISVFFITYTVFKLKNFLSGPMTFKSNIDFKNAFENRFLFSRELQMLNVVFSGNDDDNITTFETIELINIINRTQNKGFTFYDDNNKFFPYLQDFPVTRRFYFVYKNMSWKVQEAEETFFNEDYSTTQYPPSITSIFPMDAISFFSNYIKDMYSFKSIEFPIFFRKYIGYLIVSDYIIEGQSNIVNI